LARYPYRILKNAFDRVFRNDLNKNFEDIEADIKSQSARVDNLINEVEQPSEVVDARVDADGHIYPVLKERLDTEQHNTEVELLDHDDRIQQNSDDIAVTNQSLDNLISRIGNNDDLDTTQKATLILAINEINSKANRADQKIDQNHDEVMSQLAQTNEQFNQAKDEISKRVKLKKDILGGQFPEPFRVPVINTDNYFPNQRTPYRILYAEGDTLYAIGGDSTIRKSTDGGDSWEVKGYNNQNVSSSRPFLKSQTGTLLTFASNSRIIRSTDDGTTWNIVHSPRPGTLPLGTQSWDIDEETGYIYYGEYNNAPQTEIILWVSKDDGETWEEFKTFSTTDGPQRISHIHAVQYDHFAKRIVICTGDGTEGTGLWRINKEGTDIEPIVINSMFSDPLDRDIPRSIGIMPFENYIVWAGDTTLNPYVFRMARSEIGKDNPVVERLYRLNGTAWFTCKASDDGNTWIITASQEGATAIDDLVHIYAITDEGETVWEVGTIPSLSGASASALMPLGRPSMHGDTLWMASREMGSDYTWKFRVGYGFGGVNKPDLLPRYRFTQTLNTTGEVTLGPGEEIILGNSLAQTFARRLYIFESSISVTDAGGVSPAYQRLLVRKQGDNEPYFTYSNQSERYTKRLEQGLEIDSVLCNAAERVEFVLKNTHSSVTIKITANITFAWGL